MQVPNSLKFIKWSHTAYSAGVNRHSYLSALRAHNEKTRGVILNYIKLVIKSFWLFSWRKRYLDFSGFKGK